ncbi:unnamed protein product [Kluyveromyces dobzhanskii CBS 2104]|uniref:Pre-rRNA-processing protein RIX1 n=1 Tax=Kluyveromyces dobzhanskii CBS 2104 TaxID=1427455 RepID=A0A0A8L1T9_9SACH|nr:unnamed protein product [Kluyveromyces dobzhanskii CBS 2104]
MSTVSVPLASLANIIEESEGSQFRSILQTLRSPIYVNQSLLKSDIAIFVAKLLKLLRSSEPYQLWKGCHAVAVLCSYNPVVLCSQANQLLTVLYTRLESLINFYAEISQSKARLIALRTLTRTVDNLMDLIRGKPTLTREALTPKLNAIIPLLITLCQYEPELCLPILKKLLLQNTTTFKPFANKYRVILNKLITKEFQLHDKTTQRLICDNYAYLHLIKQSAQKVDENLEHHKAFMDEHWRSGLFSILYQFKPLIQLCGDILDFSIDPEVLKLVDSLPSPSLEAGDIKDELFGPLSVDMNESFSLWEISYRVEVLSQLLISFVSLPTPFALRIPLDGIIEVSQALLMLSTNYLPLKRGLRREVELTAVIISVLRNLQYQGVLILKSVSKSYGKDILYYYSSILSSLELFIPIKARGNSIDYDKVESMKEEIFDLLSLINVFIDHIGHKVDELDLFTKLTDVTLRLVEEKSNLGEFYSTVNDAKTIKQTTKQKKDFNKMAGAMSDIYSHPKQFVNKTQLKWYDEANTFLSSVIKNWKLPSTQQVNIIKYTTIMSITLKEQTGSLPASFEMLLTTLVLNPGLERVSILPIAVGLLKDSNNQVLDVLCHPRLPISSVLNAGTSNYKKDTRSTLTMRDTDNEEFEQATVEEKKEVTEPLKEETGASDDMEHISAEEVNVATITTPKLQAIVADESQIFRKRNVDEANVEEEQAKRQKSDSVEQEVIEIESIPIPAVQDTRIEGAEVAQQEESESDSDIEIPTLNVSDNDDDDEDE